MSLHRSSSLRDDLRSWVDEGLVSPESASILSERYELDAGQAWYRNSSYLIGVVASFLVTAGIVLVISENWHRFGIAVRMGTGILPWLAVSFLTVRAVVLEQHRQKEVWGLFTSLLFGANIFLQAQIFHISGFWPTGVMWWSIGSFVMALVLRSPSILVLSQALVVIWINGESSNSVFNPFIIIGVIAVVLASWKHLSRLTLTTAIVVLYSGLIHIAYNHYEGAPVVILNIALLLLSAAIYEWADPISRRFRDFMFRALAGVLIVIAAVYYGSIKSFQMSYHLDQWIGSDPWFPAVLTLVGALLLMFRRRDWLAIGISCVTVWIVASSFFDPSYMLISAYGVNVLLLTTAVALVWSSIKSTQKTDFMFGLVLIVLLALARFNDYFGDYLIGAVVFSASGILLFIANLYWKKLYEKS